MLFTTRRPPRRLSTFHRVGPSRPLILAFAWCLLTTTCFGEEPLTLPSTLAQALEAISADRMRADVRTLSSPAFNGRQTGTVGDHASADFVRQRLESLLSPPGQIELQAAPVTTTSIGQDPLLRFSRGTHDSSASIGTDYLPILDSPSADVTAKVVFVGYGIADPAGGLDEYAELDVRNKIVLFLRGKPDRYEKVVSHAEKERVAREHGAVGYLTAVGPILSPYELRRGVTGKPSAFYGLSAPGPAIPGAWISTALASTILRNERSDGEDRLQRLQQQIQDQLAPRSEGTSVTVTMRWQSEQRDGMLYNVLAVLSGSGQAGDEETLVIGAHRDHFGRQGGLLFAGADDNASGTAVLLEVARVLASSHTKRKRSIVFASFSGEEQGLLGSFAYVAHPLMPLRSTVAMLNVDHAAAGNGRLTIGVTGLEKDIVQQAGRLAGSVDRVDVFGFFPGGDHVPFKEAGIPTVTIVSGGVHPHFHQPTDTADTVNADILLAVARMVLATAWQLADTP